MVVSLLWNCLGLMDDARRVGGKSLQTQDPETAKLRGTDNGASYC